MSAIRNVGELASPYFLLEVWARREDIEIDPETYASLKRKTRSLVRDAHGFELRGDEPDNEWRARRLDLLAIEGLEQRSISLEDGTHALLQAWRDDKGHDAIVVCDLPGFPDPDRRVGDEPDPASTRFEIALDAYDGDADWGILLAGLEVRTYRRSSGISQQYLALDLDTLVELDDEPAWKAFAAMFRAPAFVPAEDGIPLIRRVVDESRRHASALAADMRRDVIDAAEAIIQGALDHPATATVIGEPTRLMLHRLFEESLYFLYRVLFVLYAESRDVLPVSGLGPYATTYSVDHLVELARRGGAPQDGQYYNDTLSTLFALLWDGPTDCAHRLGIEPVGGDLFDPGRTPTLGGCIIPDAAWERALGSIALGAPGSQRRKLGRRSSFGELGVDQLGSIYEGLLVLEPYLATERAYLGTYKGERRVFTDADTEGFDVLRHLEPGDFVLESAGGRRKGTGSFYTPQEITEYLSRAAISPLLEPILEHAADNPGSATHQLLDIKICDPAMGSGAFLVQAARILALALARIRASGSDGLVTPDRVRQAKRDVVRHCLYGVDLNPLAVVLAKVSLWLETLEPGRPLSFLDAHLRCGDSLIGIDFVTSTGDFTATELASFPAMTHKGLETYLKNEAGDRGMPVLARLKNRRVPKAAHQPTLPGIDHFAIDAALEQLAEERQRIAELEEGAETLFDALHAKESFEAIEFAEDSIRNRLRRAANFWCAQWFSDGEDSVSDFQGPVVPASVADFEEVIAKLVTGTTIPERLEPHVAAAEKVHEGRNFFHWALEFPEVFYRRGGFDAVIGNPPWNTLSPDVKEFFATFDPKTFAKRKGSPPEVQLKRELELRGDSDIDGAWRKEARYLYELSNYAKPDAGRYKWYAEDGQLRKGDANVFRLFVERAYHLLRADGFLAQVLPDSAYLSSPATGLRQHLLDDGRVQFCWVFENRRKIFPIDGRSKVVLLGARKGAGPTSEFRAKFLAGKDPAGRSRCVAVEDLPNILAQLEDASPSLTLDQIRTLFPETLAFPELQTSLDAEIALKCAVEQPALNLDERGWDLTYCRELDAQRHAGLFKDAAYLEFRSAFRDGLRWREADGGEWWPLIEGNFYHLEFPVADKEIKNWVSERELRKLDSRKNPDGTLVMDHFRMGWRLVTSPTNERGAIAAVFPPRTVAKHSTNMIWGGSIEPDRVLLLAALISSFVFDYLVRFTGRINLTYFAMNSVPAPKADRLRSALNAAAEVTCQTSELEGLWPILGFDGKVSKLDRWEQAERRAIVDAVVARAYDLSIEQFAAVLLSFPNLDRSQPMLPGEPKCFVTRDLALKAFCEVTGSKRPNLAKLMVDIGSGLPDPASEYCDLDARLRAYIDMDAIPYRPTPKGARVPTDPSIVADVLATLSDDPLSSADVADLLGEDEDLIVKVLKNAKNAGRIYAEGRGKNARYYVIEED